MLLSSESPLTPTKRGDRTVKQAMVVTPLHCASCFNDKLIGAEGVPSPIASGFLLAALAKLEIGSAN